MLGDNVINISNKGIFCDILAGRTCLSDSGGFRVRFVYMELKLLSTHVWKQVSDTCMRIKAINFVTRGLNGGENLNCVFRDYEAL